MKTRDMGYILQKVQRERKVGALHWIVLLFLIWGLTCNVLVFHWKLTASLHSIDNKPAMNAMNVDDSLFVGLVCLRNWILDYLNNIVVTVYTFWDNSQYVLDSGLS